MDLLKFLETLTNNQSVDEGDINSSNSINEQSNENDSIPKEIVDNLVNVIVNTFQRRHKKTYEEVITTKTLTSEAMIELSIIGAEFLYQFFNSAHISQSRPIAELICDKLNVVRDIRFTGSQGLLYKKLRSKASNRLRKRKRDQNVENNDVCEKKTNQ
ncbi:Hypothetical protein SRAE_1000172800 [Strongyloides ratti]|uniref:Uncharacterized protein n=1 Tax=Strongyloides ratti TaxID=34506 RepID=A0A090L183_STRRB|nr:Hypothetical protein SRAE_1000172800 [Strongyloides ratti]CEF63466.1 Hypothetical protein SRAE_1000172800 [Strongyloides ratti]